MVQERNGPDDYRIQIGLPKLPRVASDDHFEVLQQWLTSCNDLHPQCRPPKAAPLPLRLVDVGTVESPKIHIHEPKEGDDIKYIALSHPWGPPPHFCTFRSNLDEYKRGIHFEKLPATFQHAVVTTRRLGFQYLWIDSICIIQGPDGDFDQLAKDMEDVFSSAYCVLAASSGHGQGDGFLNPRGGDRDFLTFSRGQLSPLYICRLIDDFHHDVLDGPLNKRGWVLQERALARRTIYFTNTQTYWECDGGVRCESLTKMDK